MARTSDDTWGVGESVGATALGAAEWRARETSSADPLITDPYAQLFLAADALNAAFFLTENLARLGAYFGEIRELMLREGIELTDTPSLWFDEERTELVDWLRGHGWQAQEIGVREVMTGYQRGVPDEDAAGIPHCVFVAGRLAAKCETP